jgi:2-dehydropantoate 2-reductase
MGKENVLVFGAGAIGSYLAAKIYNSGHHVDVVGRKAKKIGKTLYINNVKYKFPSVSDEIYGSKKYGYLFITSKLFDLKNNLDYLSDINIYADNLITVQNGFLNNDAYKIGSVESIVSILVYDGFDLKGKYLNHVKGSGFFIEGGGASERTSILIKNSGISINKTDDLTLKRAEKMLHNCSLNIFSAIYSKNFRELFKNEAMVRRIENVFYESHEVLSRLVPNLQDKKVLWKRFYEVVRNMDHYSSSYQDVVMNRITELSFLNGFIVRSGRKLNLNTPYNIEIIKEFLDKYPDLYQQYS